MFKTFINKLKKIKCINNTNNKIVILNSDNTISNKSIKNLEIKFLGSNNYIEIHESCKFTEKIKICCCNNTTIKIGKNFQGNFQIPCPISDGCSLIIGDNVKIVNATMSMHDEPNLSITINDNTLISYDVEFRVSDGHSILDKDTNKILNYPANIIIEEHCWIGMNSLILKGSHVPRNSILGAKTMFLKSSYNPIKDFRDSLLFAGQPAKIIKENVNWDIQNTYLYQKESIEN